MPLAVGAFAISGSVAILRVLAEFVDVSVFALNLAVALGLALAIDYSLLLVSRYREEIGDGSHPDEALRRTMRTAGRTVVFSAATVALCCSREGAALNGGVVAADGTVGSPGRKMPTSPSPRLA